MQWVSRIGSEFEEIVCRSFWSDLISAGSGRQEFLYPHKR